METYAAVVERGRKTTRAERKSSGETLHRGPADSPAGPAQAVGAQAGAQAGGKLSSIPALP